MPQFDIYIYFTFFITFLVYSSILYFIISVFFVPFFWNIYYFRYLKKENNNLIIFLSLVSLQKFKNLVLNYNYKLQLVLNSIVLKKTFNKLNIFLFFIFINKIIKFILKVK